MDREQAWTQMDRKWTKMDGQPRNESFKRIFFDSSVLGISLFLQAAFILVHFLSIQSPLSSIFLLRPSSLCALGAATKSRQRKAVTSPRTPKKEKALWLFGQSAFRAMLKIKRCSLGRRSSRKLEGCTSPVKASSSCSFKISLAHCFKSYELCFS